MEGRRKERVEKVGVKRWTEGRRDGRRRVNKTVKEGMREAIKK